MMSQQSADKGGNKVIKEEYQTPQIMELGIVADFTKEASVIVSSWSNVY